MKNYSKTERTGSTTRLLQDIETEVDKEDLVIDRLSEILTLLSAKEETLLELDIRIEEETDADDLEKSLMLSSIKTKSSL